MRAPLEAIIILLRSFSLRASVRGHASLRPHAYDVMAAFTRQKVERESLSPDEEEEVLLLLGLSLRPEASISYYYHYVWFSQFWSHFCGSMVALIYFCTLRK